MATRLTWSLSTLVQNILKWLSKLTGPSDTHVLAQLRATKALVTFCELHGREDIGLIRECQSALEDGNIRKAVAAYKQVPLGGNGCFNDWWPPVVFDHEDNDYVWAVFEALVAHWSLMMKLST